MTHPTKPGAFIEQGPADWQIIQQDAQGLGSLTVAGHWQAPAERATVQVRLVHEDTGAPVAEHLNWSPAEAGEGERSFLAHLDDIPAGGLYRLETRLWTGEQLLRGDMRHFLGVGELWVIAGQSNSAGYGFGPFSDPPQLGVHLLDNAMHWRLATHPLNESTDTAHPVNCEGGNPGHGPWLAFAKAVREALGVPVGLIQTALGGSPLTAWDPTDGSDAPLYENMLEVVRSAGSAVRGLLWYQGESDCDPESCDSYLARFTSAVGAWRQALDNPHLHVLTVQLNRVKEATGPGDRESPWSVIREAQRQAARRIDGVSIVPAIDLPLSDPIHNSPAGNVLLGERAARAAFAKVYRLPGGVLAPDVASARLSGEGRCIELAFENVGEHLMSIDPGGAPFRVVDTDGEVPLDRVEYPGDETIRLHLARPAGQGAVVHGCGGTDPAALPPFEHSTMTPILAFNGLEVQPS